MKNIRKGLFVSIAFFVFTSYIEARTADGFKIIKENISELSINSCTIVPSATSITSNPTCFGLCNGTATINATGGAPFTYSWIGTSGSTSVTAGLCAGNYTCVVTNSCGLTFSKPISILQPGSVSLTAYPLNTSLCEGSSTNLFASTAGASYTVQSLTWNTGSTGASITVTPTVKPITAYTVTLLYNSSCILTATTSITVFPKPNIMINATNFVICSGGNSILTANGATTYTWNSGNNNPTETVTPSVTTTFSISGTDANSCINSNSISITVAPNPIVTISQINPVFCLGVTNTLVAGGAATYTWLPGGANTINNIISPTALSNYTLIGINTQGCLNSKTLTVNPLPLPNFTFNTSVHAICPIKDTAKLFINGGSTSYSYTWSNGTSGITTNVSPIIPGIHSFSVTATDGSCSKMDTINILVKIPPNITASSSSSIVCSGNLVTLYGSGGIASSYTWTPILVQSQNASVFPTINTTYTVYGAGANGCINFATTSVSVTTGGYITVIASPSIVCAGQASTLSLGQANYTNYQWSTGATTPNIIVNPIDSSNKYSVSVQLNSCTYSGMIQIGIDKSCSIETYTGFSPNGDGINDIWFIENIENYPNNKVYIYNRWGNKLFETSNYNNYNNAWNGTANGNVLPSGTYFYVIKLDNGTGVKKGWIELTGK
jgi:gliding motility-associated-like protein